MGVVVANSDFHTILAGVIQQISLTMVRQGFVWPHREDTKYSKYLPSANSISANFIPLVLEHAAPWNKLSPNLRTLPENYSEMPAIRTRIRNKLVNLWTSQVSCAFQRANATSRLVTFKLSRIEQAAQHYSPLTIVHFSDSSD